MSTIVTMTYEEMLKQPPMSEEELRALDEAPIVYDEDCPRFTPEQLARFRPWYEARPEWGKYRPEKEQISLRVDSDVLAWFKAQGPGYQTRMNAALRAAAFPDEVPKRAAKNGET